MSGRSSLLIAMLLPVICGITPLTFASSDPFDSTGVQAILETQTLLFNDRFAEVDSIFSAQIKVRPEDPSAYLFRAGALFAEMSDREEDLRASLFRQLLDTVVALTDRVLDTCDNQTAAWMYLWRGHARAYRSLYESKFGSSVTALKTGMSSIGEYENGLRRDSTLTDLYMGIGSYHYWKSAKAGVLRWFLLFKDEKAKGIAELRTAAASSLLHRELARSALIWIWLDRKEYDSAVLLAGEFAARYPKGRTFLWPIAQARFRQGDYRDAAATFLDLRERLDDSPGNYYNLIECDWHLAQCYTWLREDVNLKATVEHFRSYEDRIPIETRRRQSAKINYLQRIVAR